MSSDEFILNMSRKTRLRAEMTFLLLKGAGLAALVFFSIWIGVSIIAALGRALPEASRSQSEPTPLTHLSMPATPFARWPAPDRIGLALLE